MIKYVVKNYKKKCLNEINFLNQFVDNNLVERLDSVLKSKFVRIDYTNAIDLLLDAKKNGVKFENDNIRWGMDLESEHERYITEQIVKGPVFLINYPEEIKSFYMKRNKDNKTVAACDLLMPMILRCLN